MKNLAELISKVMTKIPEAALECLDETLKTGYCFIYDQACLHSPDDMKIQIPTLEAELYRKLVFNEPLCACFDSREKIKNYIEDLKDKSKKAYVVCNIIGHNCHHSASIYIYNEKNLMDFIGEHF
jgi:lysyl-tRNA synthetase class I